MTEAKLDAADGLKLAMVKAAKANGATDDECLVLLSRLDGEVFVPVEERGGRVCSVKVSRVHSVGPDYPGGTVLTFDVPHTDPFYQLRSPEDLHKVVGRLRSAGWKH